MICDGSLNKMGLHNLLPTHKLTDRISCLAPPGCRFQHPGPPQESQIGVKYLHCTGQQESGLL